MTVFTTDDISIARQMCADDFKCMVEHGARIRNHVPPDFHLHIADWLQGREPHTTRRVKELLGFRFSAKTWECARQYLKFRWLRCPWAQATIHSSNDPMAKKFVKAIRDELNEDPLMEYLRPERSASDYEFNLRGITHEQGYSLVGAGIKTSLVGSRTDIYIFDDPEPETEPEGVRDRIISAFGEAGDILHSPRRHFEKMGLKRTDDVPRPERVQMVVLGQPHHENTAYLPSEEDFEDGGEGHPLIDADVLIVDVLRKDGSWTWPMMMEEKYFNYDEGRPKTVEEVRRGMTTSRWELQYRINTRFAAKAGPVLHITEIEQVYRIIPDPILVIDPADSEDGCEWGAIVGGLWQNKIHVAFMGGFIGRAYEGDDWQTIGESVWSDIFDLYREFRCGKVYLEANYVAAATACRRYISKTNSRMIVEDFRVQGSKKARIPSALEQPVNNGILSMNPDVLLDQRNRHQLMKLRWNKLPRPNDRLDALASLVMILIDEPILVDGANQAFTIREMRGIRPIVADNRPASYKNVNTRNPWLRIKR